MWKLKWPWASCSGTTSGETATVVSETAQLIEEQSVSIVTKKPFTGGNNVSDFKETTQYSVKYIRKYSNGATQHIYSQQYITGKNEAMLMYKHVLENRGETTKRKTVKEETFKIDENDRRTN